MIITRPCELVGLYLSKLRLSLRRNPLKLVACSDVIYFKRSWSRNFDQFLASFCSCHSKNYEFVHVLLSIICEIIRSVYISFIHPLSPSLVAHLLHTYAANAWVGHVQSVFGKDRITANLRRDEGLPECSEMLPKWHIWMAEVICGDRISYWHETFVEEDIGSLSQMFSSGKWMCLVLNWNEEKSLYLYSMS